MLVLSLLLAVAAPTPWEVRYAQHTDQKPEWTAAGYLPAWTLEWTDQARPEVRWSEPEPGKARGWLLSGRPVALGAPTPAGLEVAFEYRTRCTLDAPQQPRSGTLAVFAMTSEAWSSLAGEPSQAQSVDPARLPGVLAWRSVKGQGDDVLDWTPTGPINLGAGIRQAAGETVVIGLAWGAYHYGNVEDGGWRNFTFELLDSAGMEKRFWAGLELGLPGLEAVRAALARDDLAAARAALGRYYRARPTPCPDSPIEPATDSLLRQADETLARTYRLVGTPPYTFPGQIVWNADPFKYDQWAIALNRHFHWLPLAAAWLRTGDDRYAEEWQRQVTDWVAAMPVPIGRHWIQGPYNEPGKSPLSLDAGIRMAQTWFQSFEVLRRAPVVTDDTIVTFIRGAYQHGAYLMREENFKSGSNWGAMEANGLLHLGVLLPEFREAAQWRETALRRLTSEVDKQVYPDGAQVELAPSYHGVTLSNFLGALRLARRNGLAMPAAFVGGLERMFDCFLKIAQPDLRMPALNDSGGGGISGLFAEAVELFPHRLDFLWARTSRREGQPPTFTSLVMPWAGWVVFRSGWEPTDSYLLFQAGPFGTGHQHEDKLSVLVHAGGRQLVADAGNYAYDESDWRRYVLSTRSHSTARVDGQDQNSRADRSEYRSQAPDRHGFRDDPQFAYAAATHRAGYGPGPDRSVVHRRRVLFVKPRSWLVVDDFAASDDREHTAEVQFLLDATEASVEPDGSVLSSNDGTRLQIVPLHAGPVPRIISGRREPEVVGFIPEGFERLRPAPAVIFDVAFKTAATRLWALLPFDHKPGRAVARGGSEAVLEVGGERWQVFWEDGTLRLETPHGRFEQAEPPLAAGESP